MEFGKDCYCRTRIVNLSCSVSGVSILENINFDLHCRTFYVVVGHNGSGKSSLLRCLVGEIPFTGTVEFNKSKHYPRIGYVPQYLHVDPDNPLTVHDLSHITQLFIPIWLPFLRKPQYEKNFHEALVAVKAEHLQKRKIATLSGGEQKRVILALALSKNPEILLLDEPDAGVDKQGIELFYAIISELKSLYDTSILLASHHLEFVNMYADCVFLLHNGQITNIGDPKNVFKNSEFIKMFL